jgi:hypothetical protein
MPLKAEQRSWVVILMHVMTVETLHHVTTLAATAIVPNVRATNAKIGSRLEKQNLASAILPRGFYLADSINSLAIHQPKLVYDTLLKRHGNIKSLAKPKKCKWNDILHT